MKNSLTIDKKWQFKAYTTRKRPLWDNCKLLAPDGQLLCTCDSRKAMWYMEKGLGGELYIAMLYSLMTVRDFEGELYVVIHTKAWKLRGLFSSSILYLMIAVFFLLVLNFVLMFTLDVKFFMKKKNRAWKYRFFKLFHLLFSQKNFVTTP